MIRYAPIRSGNNKRPPAVGDAPPDDLRAAHPGFQPRDGFGPGAGESRRRERSSCAAAYGGCFLHPVRRGRQPFIWSGLRVRVRRGCLMEVARR